MLYNEIEMKEGGRESGWAERITNQQEGGGMDESLSEEKGGRAGSLRDLRSTGPLPSMFLKIAIQMQHQQQR